MILRRTESDEGRIAKCNVVPQNIDLPVEHPAERTMHRFVVLALLLLLLPVTLAAQDLPRVGFFVGYSRFRVSSGFSPESTAYSVDAAGLNGWNLTVTGNINRWIGAEADFGGYYGTTTVRALRPLPPFDGFSYSPNFKGRTYLFGPRLSFCRHERFTPFIHALFGRVILSKIPPGNSSDSFFGFALGGGLDVTAVRHLAVRALQVDYVSGHTGSGSLGANNLRLSTGAAVLF